METYYIHNLPPLPGIAYEWGKGVTGSKHADTRVARAKARYRKRKARR